MESKTNKIISMVMLIIFIISSLPINSFANFITDINDDGYFTVISGSREKYGHELHLADYADAVYMLFCMQYGKTSPNKIYHYGTDFIAELKENRPEYKTIAEMVYFGYAMKYGLGIPSQYDAEVAACATQQYVWEQLGNAPSRSSWNDSYMSEGIYASWLSQTESYYNQYHNNVSFNGENKTVNVGENTTFSDTNNVLQNYPDFNKIVNGVTFSHSRGSNDLIATATSENGTANFNSNEQEVYALMPNGAEYSKGTMSNYLYINFPSGTTQNLIFSNYVDPTTFSISVGVQNVSGKIILRKTNNNGDRVAGCTFGIYSDEACTQLLATGTTGDNGEFEILSLKTGTVFVKEIAVPTGYLISSEVKRVEIVAGQAATVDFINGEPLGRIIITKVNDNGDLIEGATFVITAGETITNTAGTKTLYTKGQEITTVVTKKGIATAESLPYGKYFIQEKSAPDGYLLNAQTYIANLEYKDGETSVVEVKVGNILNAEPKGRIIINKGSPNHDAITGAVFEVRADDSITNVEKTKIYYNKGQLVGTITTTDGVAILDNIPLGKYVVKEKQAPYGYLRNTNEYPVNLEYQDENTAIVEIEIPAILDDEPTGVIEINKRDSETDTLPQGDAVFLNAEYKIYADENIYNVAKSLKYYSKDELVATLYMDKNGNAKVTDYKKSKLLMV